jgi:hypothetical protein
MSPLNGPPLSLIAPSGVKMLMNSRLFRFPHLERGKGEGGEGGREGGRGHSPE